MRGLGHKMLDGTNTVEHLSGWFYWQGNYQDYYYTIDHPEVKKYYLFGETDCGTACWICLPVSAFPALSNNSCGETLYRPLIQLDFDSIVNNTVPDMLNSTAINDLQLGSSLKTHPKSWAQYTFDPIFIPPSPLGYDANEPYVMKDRGILFKGEWYLTSVLANA